MSIEKLKKFAKLDNIAEELDKDLLVKIGHRVTEGYDEDLGSMTEWLGTVKDALELAKLKKEEKNTPFPNASNIKFPIITTACLQFAARTYPELVKDGKVVKAEVIGYDTDGSKELRAKRVSDFMSYQLISDKDSDWEAGTDKLLHTLPNIGMVIRKTWFDSIKKRNRSEVCEYKDVVIHSKTTSLQDAERITHVLHSKKNDLQANANKGLYLKKAVEDELQKYKDMEIVPRITLLEQHRYLDLDKDGFDEPYIVTTIKETSVVLRITARYTAEYKKENSQYTDIEMEGNKIVCIKPIHYFTDYHFIPSPDGKFHSMGFGTLMCHMNETVNSILNMLIDSGKLANLRGGYFDSSIKLPRANTPHVPGEWKPVRVDPMRKIQDGFLPLEYREPSNVLLQLLGILVEAAKELSSSTDALQGTQNIENAKSGAALAQIEQGLKVFNSIQRRLYRSLREEYLKLFRLNRLYLDPYVEQNVIDGQIQISQNDFDEDKVDVLPVADPNLSSDAQRFARMQALQGLIDHPWIDGQEIDRRTIELLNVPAPEKIFKQPDPNAPPPLEVMQFQADSSAKSDELKLKGREMDLKERMFQADLVLKEMDALETKTRAIKNLADAEAAEIGTQLQDYQMQLDVTQAKMDNIMQHKQMDHEKEVQDKELAQRQTEMTQNERSAPTMDQ